MFYYYFGVATVIFLAIVIFLFLFIQLVSFLIDKLVRFEHKKDFLADSSMEKYCASREEFVNNTICCYDCSKCDFYK